MISYACLKKNTFTLGDYQLFPIRKEDIFLIKEWRNSQIDVLRQQEPLTDEDQLRYYHNSIVPSFSDKYPRQILFSLLKDNRCIGYGGLVHINWKDNRAEISFLVDTQRIENKKQYENDFLHYLELMKEIAFNELKLLKITGETYDIREHHISIIEKSGFKLAGRLKQHIKINGKYIDALCHELFNSNIRKSHGTLLRIKNVLVFSISKKVPLLKRLKQSAQRIDPLVKIYGEIDSNPDCIGKYFVDAFWQTPLLNSFSIDKLIRYCKENDINSIIPSRDAELVYFSNHNRTLEKDGINVMVSDKSTIRYCSDKLEFFKQAQKYNLPVIRTAEDIDTIQADFFCCERTIRGRISENRAKFVKGSCTSTFKNNESTGISTLYSRE